MVTWTPMTSANMIISMMQPEHVILENARYVHVFAGLSPFWFKHILFMMKRIGCGLTHDKNPLLEGLFTRELTHTHSHTVIPFYVVPLNVVTAVGGGGG